MIDYFVSPWNTWKKKAIWFQPKSTALTSKSCQTYLNLVICRQIQQMIQGIAKGVSAGVKGFKCGITGRLNENASTKCRGVSEAFGSYRQLVIPIVAKSIINFNSYARHYV